ncbi:MAG: hypothetical protein JWQ11_4687, partial [Rhizobacter sp.]|nr:hypothetical protein [Rhizobacter sp.]
FIPGITPRDALHAVVVGRNNWTVWTAGNDKLWDALAKDSVGNLDLLKTISDHARLKFSRDNRWSYLGLVNEPCFAKATAPRADRFGLWLDVRDPACPVDPFENEAKYPGVQIGARGSTVPVGSYYGYATGVVGLRLFPNPDFDEAAKKHWDADKYYTDASYYNDKNLVRPYRVGMACAFCHVGPNPTRPPADPEHPQWQNLNSNPGSQYLWVGRIFAYDAIPSDFPFHLFNSARPGALDTSLVSSDYINNPRTMNAIYNLAARLHNAAHFGHETLAGGGKDNAQFNSLVPAESALQQFYKAPDEVWTPHILKDGSDSVGALGALNRVYVNIGLYSEEWTRHFRPLIGGKPTTPFTITNARTNSSYWNANEAQTPNVALFFLATAKPDLLKDAPGGPAHMANDRTQLVRGQEVFAENCARCHSSKLPEKAFGFFPASCSGAGYLECWNAYWKWTQTDEFKQAMKPIVASPDFLDDNFLSNELRVPVTLTETNACSTLATNAIAANVWDNFSADSYKMLPSVGSIDVQHPITGERSTYAMPAGGRGYTRPASLVSLWSTAPYLLNNSVGPFYPSGSVEDRMRSFDASMEQMLWPEKRTGNTTYVTASGKKLTGQVDVTTATSYLRVPRGYLPQVEDGIADTLEKWLPSFFGGGGVQIGPIPAGTPVNLISNIDLDDPLRTIPALLKVKAALKDIPKGASDQEASKVFRDRHVADELLDISKCRDFVVNRGHYFGTAYAAGAGARGLSDADKRAMIEFLKTF